MALPFKETQYEPLNPSERKHCVNITTESDKLLEKNLVENKDNKTALDTQVGGNHYKQFKIQPIEFCQKNRLPACESNIIKYVCRHSFKNGLEDLKKAKHCIDLLIQMEYSNESVQAN
jgi:hypothetical protein